MAKLLIVDDNAEATRPLAMLFRFFKHDVDYAASGDEALVYLSHKLPDVMVLDVMMPGMDGMEVLRRMREDRRMCVVPVVMFSAVSDPAYRRNAIDKGADDYVIKGAEFDELRHRVERLSLTRHSIGSGGADCSTTDQPPGSYH